jgi:hypothetical protein
MYLERMRHRDRYGHVYHHYCQTSRKAGKLVRKYVSRAALPAIRQMIDERKAARKLVAALKPVFSSGSPGPDPAICAMQRAMLESGGYRLAGGMRIVRDRKKFFMKEQVEFRHSMLDPGALAIAKTPEDLERLERLAIRLQTALARSKVKGMTYAGCLAAVFKASSGGHGTETGASSPSNVRHSGDTS